MNEVSYGGGAPDHGGPVHQVSFGGKLPKDDGTFDTFAFVVQSDDEGKATGQGGIQAHGHHYHNHWAADCLEVNLATNEAWIGVHLTHESPQYSPPGNKFTLHLRKVYNGVEISYPGDGIFRPYKPCSDKPNFIQDYGSNTWEIGVFKMR
jgi:hypothetical protein